MTTLQVNGCCLCTLSQDRLLVLSTCSTVFRSVAFSLVQTEGGKLLLGLYSLMPYLTLPVHVQRTD